MAEIPENCNRCGAKLVKETQQIGANAYIEGAHCSNKYCGRIYAGNIRRMGTHEIVSLNTVEDKVE